VTARYEYQIGLNSLKSVSKICPILADAVDVFRIFTPGLTASFVSWIHVVDGYFVAVELANVAEILEQLVSACLAVGF